MTKRTETLIRGLWPLPGGNTRYLHTLNRILRWMASVSEPTLDDAKAWLMSEYSVKESTSHSYLRVVIRLGAVDAQAEGKLALTPFGRRILEAEGEAKARAVVERFMRDYLAFAEVLAFYAQADGPVHLDEMVEALQPRFPRWTSTAQFEYRALWLVSTGCLRQDRGRYYEITALGKELAAQFPPSEAIPITTSGERGEEPPTQTDQTLPAETDRLIAELEEAATDSQTPERLEQAIAEAFEFLGFAVDQLGETGDTDVFVQADIGPDSYSAVVDAKSRRDGKLQNLEVYTLQEHRRNNGADYAVVVASSFAGGKVSRHAEENGVMLLSVPVLCTWIRLHARTPLNLRECRAMFATSGPLEDLPSSMKLAAEVREQWARMLVDLVELIGETYVHGLSAPLPCSQLFAMLVTRLRGVRYPIQQVQEAIDLLSHPAIGAALGDGQTGISLVMDRGTLVRALRALADLIDTAEAETEV